MAFDPSEITLQEAGADDPYDWRMCQPLDWTGPFGGQSVVIRVPASADEPFTTDLASVPRCLTWLFPRYGNYTKAAVLHDSLCQRFQEPELRDRGLRDRSDADEIFRVTMQELRVPWARRWLMWSAVSWATLFGSLWPGRTSNPVLRWVGRIALVVGVLVIALLVDRTGMIGAVRRHHGSSEYLRLAFLGVGLFALLATLLMACGYVGLGRWDRWHLYLRGLGMTVLSTGLLAAGAVVAVVLVVYLFFEDPRRWVADVAGRVGRVLGRRPVAARSAPKARRLHAIRAS